MDRAESRVQGLVFSLIFLASCWLPLVCVALSLEWTVRAATAVLTLNVFKYA